MDGEGGVEGLFDVEERLRAVIREACSSPCVARECSAIEQVAAAAPRSVGPLAKGALDYLESVLLHAAEAAAERMCLDDASLFEEAAALVRLLKALR